MKMLQTMLDAGVTFLDRLSALRNFSFNRKIVISVSASVRSLKDWEVSGSSVCLDDQVIYEKVCLFSSIVPPV